MKTYIGTKEREKDSSPKTSIVQAESLHENVWLKDKNKESMGREGYLVIYDNGYKSWLPKDVFEAAYREISLTEKNLIYNHDL